MPIHATSNDLPLGIPKQTASKTPPPALKRGRCHFISQPNQRCKVPMLAE